MVWLYKIDRQRKLRRKKMYPKRKRSRNIKKKKNQEVDKEKKIFESAILRL